MSRTNRDLLKAIGVGDFNATMVIQDMFTAPATTDPRSAPIVIMVQHIQRTLNDMGAGVPVSGYLDQPTAAALRRVVGPNWERISWSQNIAAIVDSKRVGISAAHGRQPPGREIAVGDVPSLGFLPDVPGGMLTYILGGVLAWHYFKKGKGKS